MMEYYKILHTESGELMCYGKTPEGSINFVCDVLGEGYHAETISKEEYERETEEDAKKLTDDEVVKAVMCCIKSDSRNDCEDLQCPACDEIGCFFMNQSTEYYPESLIQEMGKAVLEVIKRKDAEIEHLNNELETADEVIGFRETQIKDANKNLVEKLEKEIIAVDISTGFGSEHYKEVVPWEKIKELTKKE